ncbi:TRAK1 protein, partial [Polyodon spathula]|nr:TRAK1 protein [Polyodon spathula]
MFVQSSCHLSPQFQLFFCLYFRYPSSVSWSHLIPQPPSRILSFSRCYLTETYLCLQPSTLFKLLFYSLLNVFNPLRPDSNNHSPSIKTWLSCHFSPYNDLPMEISCPLATFHAYSITWLRTSGRINSARTGLPPQLFTPFLPYCCSHLRCKGQHQSKPDEDHGARSCSAVDSYVHSSPSDIVAAHSKIANVCNSTDLPEVEIISLLEEQLPHYKLRADTIYGYDHDDWLHTPLISPDANIDLTTEQIQETLKYFRKSSFLY